MKEIWKDIKGYEKYYQVSKTGKVRRKTNPKYKSRINYVIKGQIDNSGYMSVLLSVDGFHKRKLVHRLVAEAFMPNPKNKPIVDHKDFDKENNNKENLDWVSQSENCKRAIKAGRLPDNKGERHGMSKLKECQVLEIRERSKNETGYKLAKEFNVSDQTVYDIVKKRRWKHL